MVLGPVFGFNELNISSLRLVSTPSWRMSIMSIFGMLRISVCFWKECSAFPPANSEASFETLGIVMLNLVDDCSNRWMNSGTKLARWMMYYK